MNHFSNRRKFIKAMLRANSGVALFSFFPVFAGFDDYNRRMFTVPETKKDNSVFPFFKYAEGFHIGEYIPKDQGGKFVQMELLGTEDDEVIVQKIRDGFLEEIYANPIRWGEMEKTELEKSVWLNRFYYLPSFARMYYLKKDEAVLSYMMQFIRKWIKENPRLGNNNSKYNWYDMQVAWRAIHLSWCYFLCEKDLDDIDKELILSTLKEHADVLMSGFAEQPLNDFNHQAHGALAMLYLGVLFPSFENAAKLKESAMRILNHHLEHAFYPDGGNIEQMFGYYPFETHIFRDAYLLCVYNDIAVSDKFKCMLPKMADFLTLLAQPDGTMPPVNDSYPMPVESTLFTLKELPDIKVSNTKKSNYFADSQIGVMHVDDKNSSWYLLANPAKRIGTHAHAGRLSFILWYKQQAVLLDSGCCNYDNPQLVKWYRTSKAHNTVLIDGESDKATSSDHLWAPKRITENHIANWIEKDTFQFCRMVSPQSEAVNQGVHWSRSLAIIKNKYMIIHDCFQSMDEHAFESIFHFPPLAVKKYKNKGIKFKGEENMFFIPANADLIDNLNIEDALLSVEGEGINAPMASYRFRGKGTIHFVLVCIPESDSILKIKQKDTPDGTALMISQRNMADTVILMRNSESDEISAFGYKTSQLFKVNYSK